MYSSAEIEFIFNVYDWDRQVVKINGTVRYSCFIWHSSFDLKATKTSKKVIYSPIFPDILKRIALFEGPNIYPPHPSDRNSIKTKMSTEHRRNDTDRGVPLPLCPPQIPHGLDRNRIQATVVRGR
jgi:hypothetical protein